MNEEITHSNAPENEHDLHAIEEVVSITGFSRHTIAVFCRQGFVSPAGQATATEREWTFDDDALRMLRHLAQLHHHHGLDLEGLGLVGPLLAELETLRTEVRVLRRR